MKQHINGPGSWAANPWVWAVSFKVVAGSPNAPLEGASQGNSGMNNSSTTTAKGNPNG
jgi:hypothetical protein